MSQVEFALKLNSYLESDPNFNKVFNYTKQKFLSKRELTAHNWEHISRDLYNAILIGEAEEADMSVVLPAIVMHDIGFLYGGTGKTHASLGAEKLVEYLSQVGADYSNDTLNAIKACIKSHKGSMHNETPESLEAKVVADADLLEKLGPVGVYQTIRTFTEFNYPAEKVISRMSEMDELIFSTDKGKEIAEQRKGFVEAFGKELFEAYKDYRI